MTKPHAAPAFSWSAKSVAVALAKLVVLAAVVYFLLRKFDWHETAKLVAAMPLAAFAIAGLARLLAVSAAALRWEALLEAVGAGVPRPEVFRLTFAGQALNLVLPTSIGGDVYRIYGTRHNTDGVVRSTGVVIWEHFCGFLSAALLAAFAVGVSDFKYREPWLTAAVFALATLLTIVAWAVQHEWTSRWAARLALAFGVKRAAKLLLSVSQSVRGLKHRGRTLATVLGWSIVMKLSLAAQYAAFAWGLGSPIDASSLLVFLPLQMLVAAMPISFAGVGPREANTVVYFTYLGMNPASAEALAVLWLVWLYVSATPFTLAFFLRPLRTATA